MAANWSTISQPAMFVGKDRTRRMPMPAHMPATCAATAAFASILLIGTGVITPVSLFVLALCLGLVLLVSLVALISLILSGLTGRIVTVGLTEGLTPGTTKGD
ncbi:MAG TPA: hypothetical protein VKR83_16760 [Ktedonobacteraceae bacterium]|nr:hypothetical protein [Ktedonobacteraceae bacterium]